MILKNTASQIVQLGSLIKTSDGSRLTSSATVRWCKDGTWGDGAGTLSIEESDEYKYAPTQAETNVTRWAISVDHADAVQPLKLAGLTMLGQVGNVIQVAGTAQTAGDVIKEIFLRNPYHTYFVAASGGSDSNPGYRSLPLATRNAAKALMTAGDSMHCIAGTYSGAYTHDVGATTIRGDGIATIFTHNSGVTTDITVGGIEIRDLYAKTTDASTGMAIKQETGLIGGFYHDLKIDGTQDGIRADNAIGIRYQSIYSSSTWDALAMFSSCYGSIEGCYAVTNGSYGTTTETHGIFISGGAVTIRNTQATAARTIAATSGTATYGIGIAAGGSVLLDNAIATCASVHPSNAGVVAGIGGSDGSATQFTALGGLFDVTANIGAGNAYDVEAGVSGSLVIIVGTNYDSSASHGTANIRNVHNAINPTTAGRTLDVTSTGAAGIDLANVENQSTTLALSGTTIKDASDLATTLADGTNGLAAIKTSAATAATQATAGAASALTLTGRLTAPRAAALDHLDMDISDAGGGTTAAYNVDKDHTWTFANKNQTTASNIITEPIGFNALLAMDFSDQIPARTSIQSITAATFANITGTEPTVSSSNPSSDRKSATIMVDATAATANTYTLTVTVLTADGQTFVRSGRFSVT